MTDMMEFLPHCQQKFIILQKTTGFFCTHWKERKTSETRTRHVTISNWTKWISPEMILGLGIGISQRLSGLVNIQKTDGKIIIFNGKIHYFDWVIFNSYFDITRGYPKEKLDISSIGFPPLRAAVPTNLPFA